MLRWVHLWALFLFVAADSSPNTPTKRGKNLFRFRERGLEKLGSQNGSGRDSEQGSARGHMQAAKGLFDSPFGQSSLSSGLSNMPSGPSSPFGQSSSPFGASSSPFVQPSSPFGQSSSSFGSLGLGPGPQPSGGAQSGYSQYGRLPQIGTDLSGGYPRYPSYPYPGSNVQLPLGQGYAPVYYGSSASPYLGRGSQIPPGYPYTHQVSPQISISQINPFASVPGYGTSQPQSFSALQRPLSPLGSVPSPVSPFSSIPFGSQNNLDGGLLVSQGTMDNLSGSRTIADNPVQFHQVPSLPEILSSARAFISPGVYYPTFQGNPFAPPTFFGPSPTSSPSTATNQFQLPQGGQQYGFPNLQQSVSSIPNLQQSVPSISNLLQPASSLSNLQQPVSSIPNLQQLIPNYAQIAPLIQQMANSQQSSNRQPSQGYPGQGPAIYQGQFSLPPTTSKKEHR
uniref:Uncharacterized protein n=1 Tax=Lygus hesperus TaxID=30085 RepID=A0A146MFF5_LYGHE